jgi:hypothetical protein
MDSGSFNTLKSAAALESQVTDYRNDVEFVNVNASAIGPLTQGGRDDPHDVNGSLLEIEDDPAYEIGKMHFTTFNHFIDIRKGPGLCDDYDGYSYHRGSGSVGEYQTVAQLTEDTFYLREVLGSIPASLKADEGIMRWLDDQYVHAPGHEWYRDCSPAVARYSRYSEKGTFKSVAEEAKDRFPLAKYFGATGCGIPFSVFLPVDNMARYSFNEYKLNQRVSHLGQIFHAVQDASIPHHAAGCLGNWHATYERILQSYIGRPRDQEKWLNNAGFKTHVKQQYSQYNTSDARPPTSLAPTDINKVPARNWPVDMLVTWLALHAYEAYKNVWNNFQSSPSSPSSAQQANMKDLTSKAVAVSMLILAELLTITACSDQEACVSFKPTQLQIKTVDVPAVEGIDGNIALPACTIYNVVYSSPRNLDTVLVTTYDRTEADKAKKIIEHYKMNSKCIVGSPGAPAMTYYLTDGEAPPGKSVLVLILLRNEDCVQFNPDKLEVKSREHIWVICEEGQLRRVLLTFGNYEFWARKALAIIQKYGFNYIGSVGRPNPCMQYFLKAPVREEIPKLDKFRDFRVGVPFRPPSF